MADMKPTNGEVIKVEDALGRKIEIKTPGPVDTLNLMEAAGANSSNAQWMRMAMMVFAVRKIDELPFPATTDKRQLLSRADRLGNEGLAAVYGALFPELAQEAEEEPTAEDGAEAVPAAPVESEEVTVAKN